MDLSDLKKVGITFVAAGLIFAFGLVVLDKLRTTATYIDYDVVEEVTVGGKGSNVSLTYGDINTFTSLTNATGATLGSANYTVATNGTIWFLYNDSTCKTGMECNATYNYREYDTDAGTAVANAKTALLELPSNWFTIIAVVIAGVFILGLVLSGFGTFGGMERR